MPTEQPSNDPAGTDGSPLEDLAVLPGALPPERLQERVRILAFLCQLEREVGNTPDLAEATVRMVALAQQATGATSGGLVMQNEGKWVKVVPPAIPGQAAGATAQAVRRVLGRAMSDWAAGRWEELRVDDTHHDPAWKDLAGLAGDIRSVVAIPLKHQGQFQGLLALTHHRPHYFTPLHADLLRSAAWGIAGTLARARRYCGLAQERERLTAIVANLAEALFAVDAEGTIILTNPALERLVGRPAGELRGSDYRRSIPLEHRSQPSPIEQVLSGHYASFDLDMVLRDAAGEEIPVRVGGGAIPGPKGRPGGAVILLHDMRYLKEIEGLRENLTHMLVHDLKGPLTSIGATVQLLQHYPPEQIGAEKIQELLALAERGVARLTRMIEAVLDVQRLEASQLPLQIASLSLPEVVAQVLDEVSPLASENQIEMHLEMAKDLPPVASDREVLRRILWNLLDNALKYTPRNGLIRVAARALRLPDEMDRLGMLRSLPAGCWVLVEVADNGAGISDEDRERIFGKFAQGRPPPGRRRGVGLGLAFCRLAVEAHGGRIWAEGGRTRGSVFAFVLPAAGPASPLVDHSVVKS